MSNVFDLNISLAKQIDPFYSNMVFRKYHFLLCLQLNKGIFTAFN